jgi:hypothetical protein
MGSPQLHGAETPDVLCKQYNTPFKAINLVVYISLPVSSIVLFTSLHCTLIIDNVKAKRLPFGNQYLTDNNKSGKKYCKSKHNN